MSRLLGIEDLSRNDVLALTALLYSDGVEFNDREINNTLSFYKSFKFEKEFISSENNIKKTKREDQSLNQITVLFPDFPPEASLIMYLSDQHSTNLLEEEFLIERN